MGIMISQMEKVRLRNADHNSRQWKCYEAIQARVKKNTREDTLVQSSDTQEWYHLCWERLSDASFIYYMEENESLGKWLHDRVMEIVHKSVDEWIGPWYRGRMKDTNIQEGFLETSHITLAVCEAVDHCSSLFTEEELSACKEAIREKGMILCMRYCNRVETVEHMCLIEEGPVRRTLKVIKTFRQSTIIQNISIYEDSPRIDFHTKVDFQEQQMLLKAGFDVDVDAPVATYDISMGDLTRPTTRNNSFERARFEVNTHKFVDLSAEDYGVAILNDCKYGCDVAGNRMRITLIKTATFPDENQDIGLHEFCYSLYPHTGDVKQGGVREAAYRLNQPPCTIFGNLTLPEEPVLCEDMGIMMEALKKAEREEAVILRLYEHHGREREIRIRWNLPMSGVRKCNVLEQELEDDVRLDGQDIYLPVKLYEIVTLKIFQ